MYLLVATRGQRAFIMYFLKQQLMKRVYSQVVARTDIISKRFEHFFEFIAQRMFRKLFCYAIFKQ